MLPNLSPSPNLYDPIVYEVQSVNNKTILIDTYVARVRYSCRLVCSRFH